MSIAESVLPLDRESVQVWHGMQAEERFDVLAVEEPLEIRLAGCRVAVTMRTPGHDEDLAAGFLYTEGILRGAQDIATIRHCPDDRGRPAENVVNVNPTDSTLVDPDRWQRNFYATSSCGICGKASIETVRQAVPPLQSDLRVTPETLYRLAGELRRVQATFDRTGGLHAAALFDPEGRLVLGREDVGRHNAVDKVIGAMLRAERVPLHDHILLVSSRASFEVVQKAAMAGIPVVAAVSAPSSLAVDLARSVGMTLIGFLRVEEHVDVPDRDGQPEIRLVGAGSRRARLRSFSVEGGVVHRIVRAGVPLRRFAGTGKLHGGTRRAGTAGAGPYRNVTVDNLPDRQNAVTGRFNVYSGAERIG